MKTIETKAIGTIKRIIREFINAEGCLPRIEDLSDFIFDAIIESSYIRSESAAERAEDAMMQFSSKYNEVVCKGSNDELFNFLIKEFRISKVLATEIVENRPEDLY